jgi:Replication protein A C terminal
MPKSKRYTPASSEVAYDLSPGALIFRHMVSGESVLPGGSTRISVRRRGRSSRKVENAVYSYVRALRSLGKKTVNTMEIAESLSLPLSDVHNAVKSLANKGIKVRE